MTLLSFGGTLNTAVFGASGGMGGAFVDALAADPNVACVNAFSRSEAAFDHPKVRALCCDPRMDGSLQAACKAIEADGPLHLCIIAIGMLHGDAVAPEKSWRSIEPEPMQRSYEANAVAPILIASRVLELLTKDRKSAVAALSARVGMIDDNRLGGWISYRMAKSALNMGIKTLSIELKRRNPKALIVGLHPGTVDTGLSKPFQGNVPDGRLFTPQDSVSQLLSVLEGLTAEASGNVYAYDGKRL